MNKTRVDSKKLSYECPDNDTREVYKGVLSKALHARGIHDEYGSTG